MNEKQTFERFFRESYSRLYYFAYNMVKDGEVCRDIVSDSFAQLWKHRSSLAEDKYYSYISQIVYNKSVDFIRRQLAQTNYAAFYQAVYGENPFENAEKLEHMEEQIQQIYDLMDTMTPTTRRVLELCYFNNKKYSEAAELMGVSKNTVKKHVVQALKTLRENMLKKPKNEA